MDKSHQLSIPFIVGGDISTVWYLTSSLIAHEGLKFHMMNIVIAYLYGSLDSDIYVKLFERINFLEADSRIYGSRKDYSINLSIKKHILQKYDNSHQLSIPFIVGSLHAKKYHFIPREEDEKILGPKVPYLCAIAALMYIANYTHPNILFSVNLLSRYSFSLTRIHWNEVKHTLRYLRGTMDIGVYFIQKYHN